MTCYNIPFTSLVNSAQVALYFTIYRLNTENNTFQSKFTIRLSGLIILVLQTS